MKQSMNSGTVDNISCIFICFSNFKKIVQKKFHNFNINNNKINDLIPREIKEKITL